MDLLAIAVMKTYIRKRKPKIIKHNLYYWNYDGTTLLYTEEVINGEDGVYAETYTRPSDAAYDYTFAGWSLEPNATSSDIDALGNVTADRNVYAAYTSTIHTYTVRFYNSSTLLQTSTVNWGNDASYTGSTPVDPSGEGKDFKGWDKPLTNIQANTDFYAEYIPLETITDTWDQIIAAVEDGTYSTKYSIGDTKLLDLGTEGNIPMQIAAFDTDDRADGGGKAEITWIAKKCLNTTHRMNPQSNAANGTGVYGGWEECEMRSYLHDTILPLVPNNVATAIKPVFKAYISYTPMGEVSYASSADMLWIPSMAEVFGTTTQRDPLSYSGIFTDDASRIRKVGNNVNWWVNYWWLRWVNESFKQFLTVTNNGIGSRAASENSYGVLLCFCMGNSRPFEIQDSWDTIIANVNNGTADKYAIGSYKPIDLGTEGIINMQIVGKNVDELANSSGNAALSFIGMELLNTQHRMNPAYSEGVEGTGALGGWEKCEMRSYLNDTISLLIPNNVKSAIKPVIKYSYIVDTITSEGINNSTTIDTLWIPSAAEMNNPYSQYSYIKETIGPKYTLFTNNTSYIKHTSNTNDGLNWWLRTVFGSQFFNIIEGNGRRNYSYSDSTYKIALGFCI